MNKKNLKISELDFLGIKQNLLNYLKQQEEFTSYNFEGSALNILLDILSYNTYYNAYYNNITISEMFLDSAIKRSSIVSIAKHLNYFPRTITAPSCLVEIAATLNDNNNNFYIPKYTSFIANRNGQSFSFLLMEDAYFFPITNEEDSNLLVKKSKILTLKQGKLKTFAFIYDINNFTQKFIIPFENVDSSTLVVKIQPNSENTEEIIFNKAKNITEINQNSNVYFLQENSDGLLEIFFGDDILGTKLLDSSIIRIEILQTDGELANGVGTINSDTIFSINQSDFSTFGGSQVPNFVNLRCKVIQPSFGGSPKENKNSIKYNAVRNYTSAERAVTSTDYKNIILMDNPQIQDIIVWGGEQNEPPDYGKVFVCAKPVEGSNLSPSEKNNLIKNLTTRRNVVGVQVDFKDPNVIYLNLKISVKIDPIELSSTVDIEREIKKTINNFFSLNVRKFDADFYSAELIEEIQNIDNSIISNTINVILEKRFIPNFIIKDNYILDFNNKISTKDKIYSNTFGYLDKNNIDQNCQLENNEEGIISIFYKINNKKIYIEKNIGIVDFNKGIIKLYNFKPSFLIKNEPISIFVVPTENDIVAKKETILEFDFKLTSSLTLNQEFIPYRNK